VRRLRWFLTGVVALALVAGGAGYIFLKTRANGFSARARPSALEAVVARTARDMAVPAGALEQRNPVADSEEARAEGRAHWADHCALCHANDGSGQTEMGRQMYPPAPDMRREGTQRMTDGELFYIIENGIRLSGMPAWGSGTERDREDTWKLVRFIRHLPALTAAEEEQMKGLNPRSPQEIQEEQEEKEFLNGGQAHEHAPHQHH
jgi:mono/diheme cytochrome c family protein